MAVGQPVNVYYIYLYSADCEDVTIHWLKSTLTFFHTLFVCFQHLFACQAEFLQCSTCFFWHRKCFRRPINHQSTCIKFPSLASTFRLEFVTPFLAISKPQSNFAALRRICVLKWCFSNLIAQRCWSRFTDPSTHCDILHHVRLIFKIRTKRVAPWLFPTPPVWISLSSQLSFTLERVEQKEGVGYTLNI